MMQLSAHVRLTFYIWRSLVLRGEPFAVEVKHYSLSLLRQLPCCGVDLKVRLCYDIVVVVELLLDCSQTPHRQSNLFCFFFFFRVPCTRTSNCPRSFLLYDMIAGKENQVRRREIVFLSFRAKLVYHAQLVFWQCSGTAGC